MARKKRIIDEDEKLVVYQDGKLIVAIDKTNRKPKTIQKEKPRRRRGEQ